MADDARGTSQAGERIADLARARSVRVAVAESLTGGQLSAALAAAPDAQDWYLGAVVAYAVRVKHSVLQVPDVEPASDTCARAMAEGARRLLEADVAVATTGVGGPDPVHGIPAGSVWVAVSDAAGCRVNACSFAGPPEHVVAATVDCALTLLLEHLEQLKRH